MIPVIYAIRKVLIKDRQVIKYSSNQEEKAAELILLKSLLIPLVRRIVAEDGNFVFPLALVGELSLKSMLFELNFPRFLR